MRGALGCARSSRQTVTALGTARLQNVAAGPGAHPVAEAVLLGTAAVVGLVGALHAALLELLVAAFQSTKTFATARRQRGGTPEQGSRLRARAALRQLPPTVRAVRV